LHQGGGDRDALHGHKDIGIVGSLAYSVSVETGYIIGKEGILLCRKAVGQRIGSWGRI
jgi:hypothetical protein